MVKPFATFFYKIWVGKQIYIFNSPLRPAILVLGVLMSLGDHLHKCAAHIHIQANNTHNTYKILNDQI